MLAVAWGCRSGHPGRLHVRLILQPHDTLQFTAEAWVRRCAEGRGFVLAGIDRGSGVLMWLHSGDSIVVGQYPVLARGDTIAPRGVAGAVRFMLQGADHGATLDSGVVTVSSAGRLLEAQAYGSGLDPRAGQHVVLDASFHAVRLAADAAQCRAQL